MISQKSIEVAALHIASFIHHTPVFTSAFVNRLLDAEVYFKCENLQKTGSFKARGATNAILKHKQQKPGKPVATHSSGNHGQALAWAAAANDIPAFVVMPSNAPRVKRAAVEGYGAEVITCESTLQAREETLEQVLEEKGASFIPPYNFHDVIEGQASCALEILEEVEKPDYILAPVGGGGLVSGTALTAHFYAPGTKVIACEPAAADDAFRSFHARKLIKAQNPDTVADGLRTSLGEIPFQYILEHVEDIWLAEEPQIIEAMKMIWQRLKLVVEPSAAVPLAATIAKREKLKGQKLVIILSGGNVDLENLPF